MIKLKIELNIEYSVGLSLRRTTPGGAFQTSLDHFHQAGLVTAPSAKDADSQQVLDAGAENDVSQRVGVGGKIRLVVGVRHVRQDVGASTITLKGAGDEPAQKVFRRRQVWLDGRDNVPSSCHRPPSSLERRLLQCSHYAIES